MQDAWRPRESDELSLPVPGACYRVSCEADLNEKGGHCLDEGSGHTEMAV